ncbi:MULTISPECIES: Trk system potassium transporter TrkA [Dehalobacter]|uniref:Trk system potassium uptake protein TrkA n=1 Tax=Dehalobacter restrictus (strain DSM 9455 / PER-K23) TaxID=871738 RepID=A0ABN4C0L9_DEHRP|nr:MULTISPECIES: Trk system potassium transporter TrkA [Dehalobacter]AHF11041.1 potassium transporter TrkA [Dehalobacter restrictus DSM 9455]MCG1024702.1 Trk system potassium transporter TrkA [Dehalobacter sp.]MDJ0305184.1 Trk system potassium transporter TrkA [Dehalobacter sp.]OCZ53903.1 Trk system potassium transport protein TrkA [Dehalobacter sp. TeCB1]
MRVVIVGAGKVGFSLAQYLVDEDHDVIVIEEDETRRNIIQNSLDVMTIQGNGASPRVLMNADVRSADLMIAVTDSDEVNMVACMAAKQAGIHQTIARIRNSEYIGKEEAEFHRSLGIDLTINPEHVTAVEISRILFIPAALEVEDFADGKVRLLEVRIRPESPHTNIPISELDLPKDILIVGILRKNRMIIPNGAEMLKPSDNVFLVGDPQALNEIQDEFTEKMVPVKKVMLIGAGRIGRNLAVLLEKAGMIVKVIDKNPERCQALAKSLKKGTVYCGEGTDVDLLMEEGVGDADAVVCLTDDDKLNLLLALMAKDLGAQKTICRVGRTEYIPLMEKVGVDSVLSPRLITAGFILSQVRRGKFISVALLEGAKAQAMEIGISPTSKVAGKKLKEVRFPYNCLVGAVLHQGRVYVPNGESVLMPGDQVIIFALPDTIIKVNKFF